MMKLNVIIFSLLCATFSFGQSSTSELKKESLSDTPSKPVVSGFYNRINVGVLGGSNVSPSFNIINGVVLNDHWSAGVGLGLESFFNRGYIPSFLEMNYNLLKHKTSPWVSIMAGYHVPLRGFDNLKGGPTLGGKVGFTYFVGEHIGISTSVGYRYAYLRDATNGWGWDDFVIVSHINRFECRVGLVFK